MTDSATLRKRHGKRYAEGRSLVTQPSYSLAEAVALLTKVSKTKFDATAEAHVRIHVDPTQSDQIVRGTVTLPHGTGRRLRIAAFVTPDFVKEAREAGADHAGSLELIREVEGGMMDFDVTVAMPQVMKDLGKLAKILGPKGLMPSPKAGTVSDKPAKIIEELKRGRIEFKMDKQGILHCVFGKVSFGEEKLRQNLETLVQAIKDAQPSAIKSAYVASLSINPTMGPGVRVAL